MPMNLTPITSIDVDLNTPIHIPVVQAHSLYAPIEEEIKAIEEDSFTTYFDSQGIWKESVDPSIVKQYEAVKEEIEEKYKLYDADGHGSEHDAITKEIIHLEEKKDAIYCSAGTHICHNCVYCHITSEPIHLAICTKDEYQDIVVRPHSIACPAFSMCYEKFNLKKQIAQYHRFALKEKSKYFKDQPISKESQKDILTVFVPYLYTNPEEAFLFYKQKPLTTISLYKNFPEAFEDTPYPTFSAFYMGYDKWCNEQKLLSEQNPSQSPNTPSLTPLNDSNSLENPPLEHLLSPTT